VRATSTKLVCLVAVTILASGCGAVARDGRAPAQVVIASLLGASGATPDLFGNTVDSDVITEVDQTVGNTTVRVPTVFSDPGQVTMSLIPKDPGNPGAAVSPSDLNQVTITRYRVTYRRSDGRNAPGVDVPQPFDSAATFTVPATGVVTANFSLVRHVAKLEPPLLALTASGVLISTVADVSFYGRDQTGRDVTVVGSIGITFGNFGDPQ